MAGEKKSKEPKASTVGQQMDTVLAHLKHHKSLKSQHAALCEMHDAAAGRPKQELLKKAYWAGWKFAEENLAINNDDDPTSTQGAKNEEERVVDVIRRGWPDPLDKAMRTHNKIVNKQQFTESASVKDLAKVNSNSPEVTV